jgi:hypothetical protein
VLVAFTLAAAPPPAFQLHAWAGLPGVCLAGRGRGSSAPAVDPLPRKPRREAKSKPEAGRRPGDLLRPPARDHLLETTCRPGGAHGWHVAATRHTSVRWRTSDDADDLEHNRPHEDIARRAKRKRAGATAPRRETGQRPPSRPMSSARQTNGCGDARRMFGSLP